MTDLRTELQTALATAYILERELGRGGMATVFLAQDLKHKRPVALKVLHPDLAHTLGPERFQREIEMAARLQHPTSSWSTTRARPLASSGSPCLTSRARAFATGCGGRSSSRSTRPCGSPARPRRRSTTHTGTVERQAAAAPDEPQSHALLGLALAYLGRRAEAIRIGESGRDLLPIAKDAEDGPYQQHQLARIYILLDEPERALDQLEPLLEIPYYLSPGWLRIDPTFAPLRGNPRFERLVEGRT